MQIVSAESGPGNGCGESAAASEKSGKFTAGKKSHSTLEKAILQMELQLNCNHSQLGKLITSRKANETAVRFVSRKLNPTGCGHNPARVIS